jgi:hypothetical protein
MVLDNGDEYHIFLLHNLYMGVSGALFMFAAEQQLTNCLQLLLTEQRDTVSLVAMTTPFLKRLLRRLMVYERHVVALSRQHVAQLSFSNRVPLRKKHNLQTNLNKQKMLVHITWF